MISLRILDPSAWLRTCFRFWIGRIKRKTSFCLTLFVLLFSFCFPANAQQQKVAKIGWLGSRSAESPGSGRELFRRGLAELGYIEGKNLVFEYRSVENKLERLSAVADELFRLKVDVLVTSATAAAIAAKNATRTIPIVFLSSGDPVALGLVDSLARPGGNMTGFTTIAPILAGKRLELLKEMIPKLSRVAVLWDPKNEGNVRLWRESQLAARELGLQLHSMEVSSAEKYESAFKEAMKVRSAALIMASSPLASSNRKQIVDLAAKNRLPAVYPREDYVQGGGLMSYGPQRAEPYGRLAFMVDKILKGSYPANIPVEQPTKFQLVINLNTAKQMDLTIPPNVLSRVDSVIK